jgi:prepilin peptidase CpaA
VLPVAFLTGALLVASWYDIVARRIPNALVLCVASLGLAFALFSSGPGAFGRSLAFLFVGIVLWLPFYALGMLGAGDVKLFAACCAWLTTIGQVLIAALGSAVAGGALAIVWALAQGRAAPVIGAVITRVRFKVQIPIDVARAKVPYAVAMAAGILWSFVRVL